MQFIEVTGCSGCFCSGMSFPTNIFDQNHGFVKGFLEFCKKHDHAGGAPLAKNVIWLYYGDDRGRVLYKGSKAAYMDPLVKALTPYGDTSRIPGWSAHAVFQGERQPMDIYVFVPKEDCLIRMKQDYDKIHKKAVAPVPARTGI